MLGQPNVGCRMVAAMSHLDVGGKIAQPLEGLQGAEQNSPFQGILGSL